MPITTKVELNSPIFQPGAVNEALARVVGEAARDIALDVKEQMRAPKHGRMYGRGVITRRAGKVTRAARGSHTMFNRTGPRVAIAGQSLHRASAPGEAPAINQGHLVNSIFVTHQEGALNASVDSPLVQAAALENGVFYSRLRDRAVIRIEPRPAFGPALERAQPKFVQQVEATVKELCDG
jgi:hypothetical protein